MTNCTNFKTAGPSSDAEAAWFSFGSGERHLVILPGLSIHSLSGAKAALESAFSDFLGLYTVYVLEPGPDILPGNTVGMMADAYAALLKELGIEKADVFGVSLGGMYAMVLSAKYPELVRRTVIGSSSAWVNPTERVFFDDLLLAAEAKDEERLSRLFVESVYSEAFREQYSGMLGDSVSDITDAEFRRFANLAKSCVNADLRDLLSDIHCPVFVLASREDRVFDFSDSEMIAKATGGRLFLYSGYGHAVYDEAPDFRGRILNFFIDGDL